LAPSSSQPQPHHRAHHHGRPIETTATVTLSMEQQISASQQRLCQTLIDANDIYAYYIDANAPNELQLSSAQRLRVRNTLDSIAMRAALVNNMMLGDYNGPPSSTATTPGRNGAYAGYGSGDFTKIGLRIPPPLTRQGISISPHLDVDDCRELEGEVRNAFNQCADIVVHWLQVNSFARFKLSETFQSLIEGLMANRPPSSDQQRHDEEQQKHSNRHHHKHHKRQRRRRGSADRIHNDAAGKDVSHTAASRTGGSGLNIIERNGSGVNGHLTLAISAPNHVPMSTAGDVPVIPNDDDQRNLVTGIIEIPGSPASIAPLSKKSELRTHVSSTGTLVFGRELLSMTAGSRGTSGAWSIPSGLRSLVVSTSQTPNTPFVGDFRTPHSQHSSIGIGTPSLHFGGQVIDKVTSPWYPQQNRLTLPVPITPSYLAPLRGFAPSAPSSATTTPKHSRSIVSNNGNDTLAADPTLSLPPFNDGTTTITTIASNSIGLPHVSIPGQQVSIDPLEDVTINPAPIIHCQHHQHQRRRQSKRRSHSSDHYVITSNEHDRMIINEDTPATITADGVAMAASRRTRRSSSHGLVSISNAVTTTTYMPQQLLQQQLNIDLPNVINEQT
jgi:hypothetical protein